MPRSSDFRRHAIVFTGIAAAVLSILGIILFASDLSGQDLSDLPSTIWVALRDGFTLATSANNIIITVPTSAFASLRGAFGKRDDQKHVEASRGTTHVSGMYFSRVEDVSKVLGGIVFTQDHSLVLALANIFADNATCPITYDPLRITSAPTDVCPRFYVGVNLNNPEAGLHVNGGILSEDTIVSKGTITAEEGFIGTANGMTCNSFGVCTTISGLLANDTSLQNQIDIIVAEVGLNLTYQCTNDTFCDIVTRVTNSSTGVITTNIITASTNISTLSIFSDSIQSRTAATDLSITPSGTNVIVVTGKVLKTNTITATTGGGTVTSTSPFKTSDATASTSPSTGALQSAGGLGVVGSGFFGSNVDAAGNVATDTIVSHTAATDITVTPTGTNVIISIGKILETDTIHTTTLNGDLTLATTSSGRFIPNLVSFTSGGTVTIPAGQVLHTDSIAATTGSATVISASPFKVSDTTDATSPTSGSLQTLGGIGVTKAGFFGGNLNSAGSVAADTYTSHTAATDIAITPTGTNVVIGTGKVLKINTLSVATSASISVTDTVDFGNSIQCDEIDTHTPNGNMLLGTTGAGILNVNSVLMTSAGTTTIPLGQILKTNTIQTTTTNGDLTLTTTGAGSFKPNNVAIDAAGNTALPAGTTLTTNAITSRALSPLTLSGAGISVIIAAGNQFQVDTITNQATSDVTITADGNINFGADVIGVGTSITLNGGGHLDSSGGVQTDSLTSHTAATDMTATPTGTNFVVASGKVLKTNAIQTTTTNGDLAITTTSTGRINANGAFFSSAGTLTIPSGQTLTLPTGTTPTLSTWDVTTLAVTMDGPCGTPGPAVTLIIRKIGGPGGGFVEVTLPTFSCTKSVTTAFTISTSLASAYRPPATIGIMVPVEEGGAINTVLGMITLLNTGQMFVWQSVGSGSFSAAGTCGMPQYSVALAFAV